MASEEEAMAEAASTGYPVLLKATGGGGGIGIYICHTPEEVSTNFSASVRWDSVSAGLDQDDSKPRHIWPR